MKQWHKILFLPFVSIQIFQLSILPSFADVKTSECSSNNTASICQEKIPPKEMVGNENTERTGSASDIDSVTNQPVTPAPETDTTKRREGFYVTSYKDNPNNFFCTTLDGRVGHVGYTNMTVDENGIPIDRGGSRHSPSSASCIPNDTRTLTSADSPGPAGPTYEEVMEEIRHAAESLEPGKPTLHQSYNNPAGTGRAEGDPNVYKGDQINFYVDDGGPYRLEADMLAGHVEIELMPSSYVIEYGNGDTATNYTAGKPVTTYPRERPRQTDTSYAYKRSGNFHAYATVHYTARFRVDGGPWQMMMVTPQATSDPLLVRVWWVDVGRVAGDCSYDDTRWGCKNDPTMGKKDNPNPRLRKADIRTGQRWHLNDNGDGDTEYSLHRDWPDM